jgi:hypothetical protein
MIIKNGQEPHNDLPGGTAEYHLAEAMLGISAFDQQIGSGRHCFGQK